MNPVTILEQKQYFWKQRRLFFVEMLFQEKIFIEVKTTWITRHIEFKVFAWVLINHALRAGYCFYCRAYYVVMVTDIIINFHNMKSTWLYYNFLKLEVRIIHSLENISIFNIWKLWLVKYDVIFGEMSLIFPIISENFWSKEISVWWFPDPTLRGLSDRLGWYIYRSPSF